jgi:predicted RNA polymerase sigma factor
VALHDEASTAAETDWPQILALYELMMKLTENPVVALNHAIATAMVRGPAEGLELLKALDSDARMARNHRLNAVRGHLLEMAGDFAGAAEQYRLAASRTMSDPEQRYLLMQAARLRGS